MSGTRGNDRSKGPVHLGRFVGRVIDPVAARRGMVTADLLAAWAEIVGPHHASCTAPERIVWPRTKDGSVPGVLVLKVDGPAAVLVQHELPQIMERINGFLGYGAIGRIRIVQGNVKPPPAAPPAEAPLPPDLVDGLLRRLATLDDDRLRQSLERLGRTILGNRRRE